MDEDSIKYLARAFNADAAFLRSLEPDGEKQPFSKEVAGYRPIDTRAVSPAVRRRVAEGRNVR
jgi:hypothetical protein